MSKGWPASATSYTPRVGRVRYDGLSLLPVTVEALERMTAATGKRTRAVIACVLDAWAAGKVWRPPRGPAREEAPVAVDELEQRGGPVRRIIPSKPEPWQKGPPCSEEAAETLVNGACYVEVARRRPPCGAVLLEHAGACYRAVAKVKELPVSVESREPEE